MSTFDRSKSPVPNMRISISPFVNPTSSGLIAPNKGGLPLKLSF